MKYLSRQILYALAMIILIQSHCAAKCAQEFHLSYKKINEELINIRKEFSATQPKVYFLLDQIEKMNRIMQEALTKKNSYKKKCHDLNTQTDILKNKNLILKQKVFDLQTELEKIAHHLVQEQSINSALKAEKESTAANSLRQNGVYPGGSQEATTNRMAEPIQEPQSLSLTSTSEPISPR